MENSDVNQRFISFIEKKNIEKKGFSMRLGIKPSAITLWQTNQRTVTVSALKQICVENKDLDARWLLTGEGETREKESRDRSSIDFRNVGGDFNNANKNSSINTGTQNDSDILKAELGKCKEELSRLKDIIMEKDRELIELLKKK